MKLDLNFFPARYGDSFLISYGEDDALKYVLIDGGTGGTKEEILAHLKAIPQKDRKLELLAVTHIDKDHIEGILKLLEMDRIGFEIADFWFNGYHHLSPPNEAEEDYGSRQGEKLTAGILKHQLNWNAAVAGKAVCIEDSGLLPVFELAGGLKLTLLSPSRQALLDLKPVWEKELEKLDLEPGFGYQPEKVNKDEEAYGDLNIEALANQLFIEDKAEANASSLAFLAEFAGKRLLLLGDAQPGQVYRSLKKIQATGKIKVDLCKISHHASRGNTSPELIAILDCPKFVISTNGSIYGHPHKETIARLIKGSMYGVELYFNYKTKHNEIWDSPDLITLYGYKVYFGNDGELRISV